MTNEYRTWVVSYFLALALHAHPRGCRGEIAHPNETCGCESDVLRDGQLLSWSREVLETCSDKSPLGERSLIINLCSYTQGTLTQKKIVLAEALVNHLNLSHQRPTLDLEMSAVRLSMTRELTSWVVDKVLQL